MKTEDKTKLGSYLPQMDINSSMLTVFEMVMLGRLPELGHRVSAEDLNATNDTLKLLNMESLPKYQQTVWASLSFHLQVQ